MIDAQSYFSVIIFNGLTLFLLITLLPFLSWTLETLPVSLSGQRGFSLRFYYKRAFQAGKYIFKTGLTFKEGICCVFVTLTLLALPSFSLSKPLFHTPFLAFWSDPLLIGTGLVLVRFYFLPAQSLLLLSGSFIVLLWTELLLMLLVPQLHNGALFYNNDALEFDASLNGVLTCSALALLLTAPAPFQEDIIKRPYNLKEFHQNNRVENKRKREFLVLFQAIWVIFLSDLMFPELCGKVGISALLTFLLRTFCIILICTFCSLAQTEKNIRYISLLLGLGLLFALAGRFTA
ncbi:hypothetical protein [Aristophania vespae]|uniref:hypothetical protein n=1 Tax=Aristophania vespae TaxID=2697033 RepID=UPI0023512674|nr:hypothetical protein [Aristophania vespae]UMM63549.1 hypothetical protein DM15PD_05230 [Aristophania vespae]